MGLWGLSLSAGLTPWSVDRPLRPVSRETVITPIRDAQTERSLPGQSQMYPPPSRGKWGIHQRLLHRVWRLDGFS